MSQLEGKFDFLSDYRDGKMVKVEIIGPDDETIGKGNCGMKQKAKWYVRKGLASIVEDSEHFYRVKLNFIPNRRPFNGLVV